MSSKGCVTVRDYYCALVEEIEGDFWKTKFCDELFKRSVDQYATTLASCFGVAKAGLPAIFPNLANFMTAKLGFMAA